MNFALFLLLNAVLLIRPEELFPEIAGIRLYLIVIVLCIVASLPALVEKLRPASLGAFPLSAFLVGYLLLMTFAVVPHGRSDEVGDLGYQCLKNGLYFFLFLATVDSVRRFEIFLGTLVVLIGLTTTLAVMQYHGYSDFQALEPYREGRVDPETGEFVGLVRLKGSGMFADPNDFCQMLLLGSMCCLARASLARGLARVWWVAPIGLFAYATVLTQSRGGLLGILAGVAALVYLRLGRTAGSLLAPPIVIAGVALAGGRQADLDLGSEGTGQDRMQLWAEAISLLAQKPLCLLTGIGTGGIADECGLVAHNSFVQAYVETGLIGGALFLCLVLVPPLVILRLRQPCADEPLSRHDHYRFRSFVFAMLVGFAVGCYSLTRNSAETTYLFLGLGAGYVSLAGDRSPAWLVLDQRFLKLCAAIGVAGLVFLKFFTQLMVRY
jgi:O-antigen ligase